MRKAALKGELLRRAKIYNYVAPGAEVDYADALLSEYRKSAGRDK